VSAIKQGDRLTDWEIHIVDAQRNAVDLTGRAILLYLKRPGEAVGAGDGQYTYEDYDGGIVVYAPGAIDVSVSGDIGIEANIIGQRSGRTKTAILTMEPVLA